VGSGEVTDAAYESVGSGGGVLVSRVVGGDAGGRVPTAAGVGVIGLGGLVEEVAKRGFCCTPEDRMQWMVLGFTGCDGSTRHSEVCRCRFDGTGQVTVAERHDAGCSFRLSSAVRRGLERKAIIVKADQREVSYRGALLVSVDIVT